MENPDGIRFGIMTTDRRRKHWAKYGYCDVCASYAGNPCRMREALGGVRTLSKPHVSRPLITLK